MWDFKKLYISKYDKKKKKKPCDYGLKYYTKHVFFLREQSEREGFESFFIFEKV